MFAKATKSRFFAVFAVMMLMLCSVAVIADADASPYGGITDTTTDSKNQTYTVPISTGQTFTYSSISTNLDDAGYGTVDYSWDKTASAYSADGTDGIKFDPTTKTLSGEFTTTTNKTKTGVLTATWTAPAGHDDKTLTQTATQTFTFEISEGLVIDDTKTAGYGMIDGTGANATILTIPFTGETTDTEPTVAYDDNASTSPFKFTVSGQNIVVKTKDNLGTDDGKLGATGSWAVTLTLKNSKTNDEDSVKIDLNVFDKIAVTNDVLTYYTYEGDTSTTAFTFTISKNDKITETDATAVITPVTQTSIDEKTTYTVLAQDTTDKHKINIKTNFGKSGDLTDNGYSKTYTATMTFTGELDSDGNKVTATTDGTFTLNVYRSLEFLSKPVLKDTVTIAKSTGTNNLMALSAYIAGAKYVSVNWGDGQFTNKTIASDSSIYNAQHKYANAGMYMITITAENDVGTTTSKVLYAVDSTLDVTPDTTDSDKKTGFFEEHGYLFLVFILILVGLLVAYFYFGIQHPFVLLLAIVCAVLAVALYVYGDFGGIIDALKGSK